METDTTQADNRESSVHGCFIAFSGGVDSTALALLHPEATPIFSDTGAEFPELYAHIDKFEEVTGREVVRIKPSLDMW